MYVLRLAKAAILTLVFLGFNPAFASELISLGELEEINANTRLEFNFKAHEPNNLLPTEAVKTNLSKLDELKKKLLQRDLGPLTLKLNITNPAQLNRNSLSFNLDLVESFDLLRTGDTARSQFVQDIHSLGDDIHSGLMLLRSPFDGAAVSLI